MPGYRDRAIEVIYNMCPEIKTENIKGKVIIKTTKKYINMM